MNFVPNIDTGEYHEVHKKWPSGVDDWKFRIRFYPETFSFNGKFQDARKAVYKKIVEVQKDFDMPVDAWLMP